MLIQVLVITIILIAIAFAGFAVKLFFKKEGQLVKHCSNIDPVTGKPFDCVCGGNEDAACLNKNPSDT